MTDEQHSAVVEFRAARREKAELEAGRFLSGDNPAARKRETDVVNERLALATRAVVSLGVAELVMPMTTKQRAVLEALPTNGGWYLKSQSGVAAERLVTLGYARKVGNGAWVGGYYVRTEAGTKALHTELDDSINAQAKAEGRRPVDEVFRLTADDEVQS